MLHKLLLTFDNPEHERQFQTEFNRWGAQWDKGMLIFTCCLRVTILLRLWYAEVDLGHFLATLLVSIPVLVEFVGRKHLEKHYPALLKDWRPTLVAGSRFYMGVFFGRCIPFWLAWAARHEKGPELVEKYSPWLWQFAASGIPLRFALTFGLPLRFAHHFPLMVFMATGVSLLTRGHYCNFLSSPTMLPTTRTIFRTSNYLAQFAWDVDDTPVTEEEDFGACPCFRLLVFTNLFWGICIASYLWWNVEFRLRIKFLRHRVGNNAQVKGIVKMMSLYPWVIATFSVPVFAILWRGSKTAFNILENLGIVNEERWLLTT